ncbi:MAG: CPBP family glutamic-type intramembrane protease, partial [Nanoarchaeota archaeon]
GGFFVLSKIAPGFSLLIPSAPFSFGNFFRGLIIIIFAPILEAGAFRSVILNFIQIKYGLSFTLSATIESTIFSIYHFLSYGIFLGALKTLTELFGAVTAISGSLITAFLYAFIVSYLVKKYNNIFVELASHLPINATLFFTVLSVGSFFSIG